MRQLATNTSVCVVQFRLGSDRICPSVAVQTFAEARDEEPTKSGSFGCTTVYVAPSKPPVSLPPRDPVISSPWRTSRLHSSIPSSPPPPHPFAQLHLHLSRTSPFHSSPHTVHRSALCNPSRGTQKPSPAFPSFSFSQRSSPGAHCRGAFQKERVMEVISDALTPLSAA